MTLGYWINKYAGWHMIVDFNNAIDLVHFLKNNGEKIESIDFISEVKPIMPRSEERQLWKDKYGDKDNI